MKVLLTGGRGMVGQSFQKMAAQLQPDWTLVCPTQKELDLKDRKAVRSFFQEQRFDLVVHGAAKVGGIKANIADPAGFLADNLLINTHVIEEARLSDVPKLIFLGSSCMYPRDYRNPLLETDILAAPLEPTNEGYALAKISGAKHCAYISEQYGLAYRTFIPCNLYGAGDHFDAQRGHLIAAAMLKIDQAIQTKQDSIEIWGDGLARREFMYVDDLTHFMVSHAGRLASLPLYLNLGLGTDYSVNEYYHAISECLGYDKGFHHNLDAPVGMRQKLMDSSLAKPYGWMPSISLKDGIQKTYDYYLKIKGQ